MTGFDVAVLLLVGLGAARGFLRGFVQEVIATLAWVFVLLAVHYLHTPLSAVLAPYVHTQSGAVVLAFALLLLVPYAGTRLVARWLGKASRDSMLGPFDRVLGFGFGAVKGTLVIVLGFALLVLVYDTIWGPDGRPEWITKARIYPFVNASSDALVKMIGERRKAAADAADSDVAASSTPAGGQ